MVLFFHILWHEAGFAKSALKDILVEDSLPLYCPWYRDFLTSF